MQYQTVGQKGKVDRTQHVWLRDAATGEFKCVLCGGLTRVPTANGLCERYGPLTAEERAMCPERPGRR